MGATSLILAIAAAVAMPTVAKPPTPIRALSGSAEGTATVRIVTPALIGLGYGPPRKGMEPHESSIALPDGRRMPISLFEFE